MGAFSSCLHSESITNSDVGVMMNDPIAQAYEDQYWAEFEAAMNEATKKRAGVKADVVAELLR